MKSLLFAKRNLTEMTRDPLLYIFCIGFPIAMILLFQVIYGYTGDNTPVFQVNSLIPGIMMFSYCLLMLMSALLVSKDKSTAFLRRLFTSPMKPIHFIVGYFIPFFIVGMLQNVICITMGYIFGASTGYTFVDFPHAMLLVLEMIPMMIFNISLGILFGSLLNDKSAPAITSIFISGAGILGGAWMPLDAMGGFEKACGFMPFYPAVYLGRIITGATHTPVSEADYINPIKYTFSTICWQYIIVLVVYVITVFILSILLFRRQMKSDRF